MKYLLLTTSIVLVTVIFFAKQIKNEPKPSPPPVAQEKIKEKQKKKEETKKQPKKEEPKKELEKKEEPKKEEPKPPKKTFVLEYSCERNAKRYVSKENATQFQKEVEEMGFKTKYRNREIMSIAIQIALQSPSKVPSFYIVYYWTESPQQKEFENLEAAEAAQKRLQELNCVTELKERMKKAQPS